MLPLVPVGVLTLV